MYDNAEENINVQNGQVNGRKRVKSDLSVWECNVRGIRSKLGSLNGSLAEHQPDVVAICETNLKAGQTCKINGYRNFYHGRKDRQGGGLIIAVHHTIAHGAVLVHKGTAEVMAVRLSHTAVPITIIAVYGKVGASRDHSDAEWEEILAQFRLAKARHDWVVCCGDFNRQVGDYIPGNKLTVDYGGRAVRAELDLHDMFLVNADRDKVVGGPATWVRPGNARDQQSALDLWIACPDLNQRVQKLEIDSQLLITPYRVTKPGGRVKITYTDHRMTGIVIKGINKPPPLQKYQTWAWREADWGAYAASSRRAAGRFARRVRAAADRAEGVDVEEVDRGVRQEMKKLAFKHFKRITVKKGGEKRKNRKRPQNEPREILESRMLNLQQELDKIARNEAHIGQIYQLREIISGNKKNVEQTPSAIKDPESGEEIFDTNGIKEAINRHVANTLKDLQPEPRYAELAASRAGIVGTARAAQAEQRIIFSEEDMVSVLGEMRRKNKNCHHPVTKLSEEFLRVLLQAYNMYAAVQSIPASFTETTLTMLKKSKGANNDLNGYRFIHMKPAVPRLMESLMTSRLKPNIMQKVTMYQLGGMPGTRPEEHLYVIKVVLQFLNSMGLSAWLAAYDMSKFFDVESHSDATVALVEAGVQGALLRLYGAITEKNKMQVVTAVGTTDWFEEGPLVPQGSSYGALLSALNLDSGLAATFSHLMEGVSKVFGLPLLSLIFQDDIIKMSTSRDECQLSQHAVAETISSKQLRLNDTKCKILVCGTNAAARRDRASVQQNPIVMNGSPVTYTTEEKYLGDWLSQTSPAEAVWITVQKRETEVKGPIQEVIRLTRDIRAGYVGPARLGITLWNSVILQKLLHNACSWIAMSQKTTRMLERVQLQFLKKLYSLPPSAPNAGTWWISGCLPLSWKVLATKFKFAHHLKSRGVATVAGRVWELERRGWLPSGLYGELLEANRTHSIPWPNEDLSKKEYAGVVDRAIFTAAYHAVREAALASGKLQIFRHNPTYGADLNDWHNLQDIQLAARAKLSCLPEFGADWGRGDQCGCGARDTFLHAAGTNAGQNCDRYGVARAAYPDRFTSDLDLLKFTREVLRIRQLLGGQPLGGNRAGG